jgi:AcrR family transcriptional regulator
VSIPFFDRTVEKSCEWTAAYNRLVPTSRIRQARRDDLVAAAIRVINREGLPSASVDRVAKEAGTTKGTALYHFASKEELFAAVVESLWNSGREYMVERIVLETTPLGQLTKYVESNLRFVVEHAEHVRAVQSIVLEAREGGPDDAIAPLRAMLEAGQRAGEFAAFDAGMVALTIRSLIDMAAFHLVEDPSLDAHQFVEEGVAFVLRAVGAAPSVGAVRA